MIRVPVKLAERSYDVVVGPGALGELAGLMPPGAARAAVVTQQRIGVEVDPGVPFDTFTVPDGEVAKSMAQVEQLCRGFARCALSRRDVVIAVGGGVVTDLAGFAAATYLRGVRYVNVATSLLAQVDAAVGGKTAVNIAEGKNLIGAFWQPAAVICDTEVLGTLPKREWASGRGEMAKYAFIEPSALRLSELPLAEQVARCVQIKAKVVGADERESATAKARGASVRSADSSPAGGRAILNYGHTLAHALEAASFGPLARWDMRHGEAVAIGLVFAAELARALGRIGDSRVHEHREVVRAFGLDDRLPRGASARELVEIMGRDKKAHHDLTFILDGPHGLELVHGIERDIVVDTLRAMGAEP